jgi:hypothetical protein
MSNTISLYNPSPEKTIDFTLEGCCPITLKTADECRVPDNSTGKVEKLRYSFYTTQ